MELPGYSWQMRCTGAAEVDAWVRLGGLHINVGQRCAPQKPDHEQGLVSVGVVKQFGLKTQFKPALRPGDVAA